MRKPVWLDTAKTLPLGGKTYTTCPFCKTQKKLVVYHKPKEYSAWCFRCHQHDWYPRERLSFAELQRHRKREREFVDGEVKLPPLKGDIPLDARIWFMKAGVSVDLAKAYGIGYSKQMDRVILPVYTNGELKAVQARALRDDQVPKYLNSKTAAGDAVFQCKQELMLKDRLQVTDTLVLTEDILSAIRVGRLIDTWSLLGTSISEAQVAHIIRAGYRRVLVWLDGDEAGIKGRRKVSRKLQASGLEAAWIETEHDPKQYSNSEIKEFITCSLKNN